MKNLTVLEALERKRNVDSRAYRTFDRGTEVHTYRISTGQGQPATSRERRVRKERRRRRWTWATDTIRKNEIRLASCETFKYRTCVCLWRWSLYVRKVTRVGPILSLWAIISSPFAAPFLALGTTRRHRLGFGDELLRDAKASRLTLPGKNKEKRIPGIRNAILGMRANSLDTAYSPLEKRGYRDLLASRRRPPFPGDEGDQELVPIESGVRSSCLASKEWLYHIVKYQSTVLSCVVQCFLSI